MQRLPLNDPDLDNHDVSVNPMSDTIDQSNTRAERWSKNSTGNKEEFLGPRVLSYDHNAATFDQINPTPKASMDAGRTIVKDEKMLAIVFCLMVVIGLGNKVFNKLMTIPMYNYANFLNLLTTFVYIPFCFTYVIPAIHYGLIPKEQTKMPKKPFAVMGSLDSIASIMQIFSATYLPGPLLILLSQAAIPVSMIISRYLLKAQYNKYQYIGAVVVAIGIIVVLAPTLSGEGSILWSVMMILSTIPMTLSSVYKEIALGETELDPMYLNGWIAVFQLIFSIGLCVPASFASNPPVPVDELPKNMYDGLMCYFGKNSISCDDESSDCTPDRCFPQAPMFVTIYIVFNQFYNLLIILILKYGSANLLYMALTLMVPLGNVAFTLPFVPSHKPLLPTDIVGLVIICLGLGCYRFASKLIERYFPTKDSSYTDEEKVLWLTKDDSTLATSLLTKEGEESENESKL